MKPLDIVKTPKGSIAIVSETNHNTTKVSITFINTLKHPEDYNSWWNSDELTVIDSIPLILAKGLAHPFGSGKIDAEKAFPLE